MPKTDFVFLGTVAVEEAVAAIMKVPVASFAWFDPYYFAPVFVSGSTEYTFGMQVVSYAGELVIGVLLLAVLVLKRQWFRQSLYQWFLGFYVATFGFWHICQGILEGAFHHRYISGATNIFWLKLLHRLCLWILEHGSILGIYARGKPVKTWGPE